VVPSFITSKRDPMAKAFFHSDSHTLLLEQCLQSVITRPAHGQYIPLDGEADGLKGLERKIEVSGRADSIWRVPSTNHVSCLDCRLCKLLI
jgi:hypothetical protein